MNERPDPKLSLNRRLESVSWAVFLIMIGCLWLVPKGTVHGSTWLFGAGAIMIGLNVVRLAVGIKPSGFTLVIGALAIAAGVCDVAGVKLRVIPILLILAGVGIILKPLLDKGEKAQAADRQGSSQSASNSSSEEPSS